MAALLAMEDLPEGFDYPPEFVRVVECELLNIEPWHVLTGGDLRSRMVGLKERFPARSLVPFAGRQDNDDIACWDLACPGAVVIVHDFAAPGFESHGEFADFVSWLRSAFDEFVDWMS